MVTYDHPNCGRPLRGGITARIGPHIARRLGPVAVAHSSGRSPATLSPRHPSGDGVRACSGSAPLVIATCSSKGIATPPCARSGVADGLGARGTRNVPRRPPHPARCASSRRRRTRTKDRVNRLGRSHDAPCSSIAGGRPGASLVGRSRATARSRRARTDRPLSEPSRMCGMRRRPPPGRARSATRRASGRPRAGAAAHWSSIARLLSTGRLAATVNARDGAPARPGSDHPRGARLASRVSENGTSFSASARKISRSAAASAGRAGSRRVSENRVDRPRRAGRAARRGSPEHGAPGGAQERVGEVAAFGGRVERSRSMLR